jgi:hypothetical protein
MPVHFCLRSAPAPWQPISKPHRTLTLLVALALLAPGCTPIPPQPFQSADPSDMDARVPAATYRPVLGNYNSQRPVEPAPWRERTDRVTPAPKKDGQ